MPCLVLVACISITRALCGQISQWCDVRDSRALDTGESVDLMPCECHFASVISRRLSTSNGIKVACRQLS